MIQVPDGWETKPFSSLASINMGQSPESEFVNENREGIAFLQGNADFGDINPKELYWVKVPKKLAKKDDILISVRAPVGDMNMADKEYCIGRGLSALTIKKINQKFAFYALFQERIQLDRLAQGSTFLAIGKNDFDKLLIKYPKEKKEQEKIAKILSTLDNAIESTNRIIEKEKNIKTALMQELLTNGIDKNGQIRTPQTHTYKQSELGLIPDEWEVVDLEKISKLITDGSHFSPEAIADSEYKIINVKDLKFDNINFQTTASITKEDYEILCNNGCSPKQNDILLSKDGTIGKVQVYLEKKQCVLLSSIAIIRLKNDFNPDFYKHYLRSFYFDTQLFGLRSGSALSRIILRDIRKLKVLFVDLEEQKQIAKILTTQDKKIEREETNLSKLKELKKGLMTDLLSGRVRVKV